VLLVEDGPLADLLRGRGIAVDGLHGFDGRPNPARMARFTRMLLARLRGERPDVVWAIGLKAAAMAVPACRLARVPLVWHKIDFSLDATVTRPLGLAVDGVVSVSEAAARALGSRLRRRRLLAVVGVPVRLDPDLRVEPARRPPAIGTAATLTPIKGQLHIIEAAALLSAEFPDLRVVLAGAPSADYPDFPRQLSERGAELGLGERVELTGFAQDVAGVLARMTVFVNATYRDEHGFGQEGLGASMIEANWVGLPVVATDSGGAPEGIRDGVTGTLVPEADPAALAAAIAPYLRDPELARATGEAGARFARERFAPQVAAARLFAALAEAAG
jgi:glycosyltransferase involved in cell wall biosynthesis